MKMKAIAVCVSIILVFATYQNVNAGRFESEFKETLAHIFREKSLLDVASLNEQNNLARKNLVEVFSQGRASGRHHDCPAFSRKNIELYRGIDTMYENCYAGLLARNPDAKHTIASHVGCGSRKIKGSQYISLSTSLKVIKKKYSSKGREIVLVDEIPESCKIIDLNDEKIRNTHLKGCTANRFAKKDCEVLLDCKRKYVPCTPLIRRGKNNKFIKLRVSKRLKKIRKDKDNKLRVSKRQKKIRKNRTG